MWDKFIQAYDEHWEVRASVTIIITLTIIGILEIFPYLWGWLVGLGAVGVVVTLGVVAYKHRQWRKEDQQP